MVTKTAKKINIDDIKERILPVLKRHGVCRAAVFGSLATGKARKGSDLDLLVEFQGEKSLLDLVDLKLDLEAEVNRKVDVLTYRSLHPLIRDRVLKEQVKVL